MVGLSTIGAKATYMCSTYSLHFSHMHMQRIQFAFFAHAYVAQTVQVRVTQQKKTRCSNEHRTAFIKLLAGFFFELLS